MRTKKGREKFSSLVDIPFSLPFPSPIFPSLSGGGFRVVKREARLSLPPLFLSSPVLSREKRDYD